MFWSTTIIRELVLNLAKVIFMLKHSVKLRHMLLVMWQHVREQPLCDMLPHHQIMYNDVISPNVLT